MIIWMDRPFANDHFDRSASYKWSSGSGSDGIPVPDLSRTFFQVPDPSRPENWKWLGRGWLNFILKATKNEKFSKEIKVTINLNKGNHFFFIHWGKWTRTGAVISSHCLRPIDLTWKARWKRIGKCSCALANRQAGELMMVRHQGVARGCYTRADMAGSPHLPEDRAPPLLLTMCLFNKSGMTFSPTSIWLRE